MESDKRIHRRQAAPTRPGALLILFVVLLFGFSLLNLFWPQRQSSELENRRLAGRPTFTLSGLLDGSWGAAFGDYMQDQVALRDAWLHLESAVNALLLGKTEEGGILLGDDHWMFTKQFSLPEETSAQLARNLNAVTDFAARWPGRVTFLLAPSAAVIYPEALPAGAPMIDENALLDDIFARVGESAAVLDLRDEFTAHKDEYLYYRTDHHWTTLGAYRAYQQFCALRGLTPADISGWEAVEVPDFYGTHYSATRWWNTRPDTLTYYPLPNRQTVCQIAGETQFTPQPAKSLIDTDKLNGRDKYAAFLGGNEGYTVIEGDGEGSILVVKDSYANCFVPFLTANYGKIGVVDYRGFAYGLDSTIEAEHYDEILILYNFQTFVADTHIVYIDRPTTLTDG